MSVGRCENTAWTLLNRLLSVTEYIAEYLTKVEKYERGQVWEHNLNITEHITVYYWIYYGIFNRSWEVWAWAGVRTQPEHYWTNYWISLNILYQYWIYYWCFNMTLDKYKGTKRERLFWPKDYWKLNITYVKYQDSKFCEEEKNSWGTFSLKLPSTALSFLLLINVLQSNFRMGVQICLYCPFNYLPQ
jgi:hypothetical protein